jgi:hypothetical protein
MSGCVVFFLLSPVSVNIPRYFFPKVVKSYTLRNTTAAKRERKEKAALAAELRKSSSSSSSSSSAIESSSSLSKKSGRGSILKGGSGSQGSGGNGNGSGGEQSSSSSSSMMSLEQLFDLVDVNGDGQLTLEEVCGSASKLGMSVAEASAMFKQMDKNGNGERGRNFKKRGEGGGCKKRGNWDVRRR